VRVAEGAGDGNSRNAAPRERPADPTPGALSLLLQELAQADGDDLLAAWANEPHVGDRVGRFEIRREIGRGGFGAVYEAHDGELGRLVALKALRPHRTGKELSEEWVKREAEAVARLDHPCIVTLFDVGTAAGGPYLVMELLRGETLAQRMAAGPFTPAEALRIAHEMARGLAHAHERGILHRDLKPANVFLCEDGRVKLLDFGLAHLLGKGGSQASGTPGYMAPEQARGDEIDARADVFAAAMTIREMLTGQRGTEAGPAVPKAIARALEKALSANRDDRPRDGTAWMEAIDAVGAAMDRPRQARRVATLVLGGLLLGAVVAGVVLERRSGARTAKGETGTDPRPTVAVADFANETGEKELDSLSGLLITSLEESTQLRVLTRSRMFDVLRQLGKEQAERIDETLAREVGRQTGTHALLLATIRKLGDTYAVDMRALDPARDEYLFTIRDRVTGKDGVFDLVDRLGAAARKKLMAAGSPEPAPQRAVASVTTTSMKAWDQFFRARQAIDKLELDEARELLQKALETDPEFALAHFQLAELSGWRGSEEYDPELLAAAQKHTDGLPDKERRLLRAFIAGQEGRTAEAIRLADQLAVDYPLDKGAVYFAGDIRLHYVDHGASVPYFVRALQLDPSYGPARDHLAYALAQTGTGEEHLEWLRREAATAQEPRFLYPVAKAFLAIGREKEAVEVYERAVQLGGDRSSGQTNDLAFYRTYNGRASEAEAELRAGKLRPRALAWVLETEGRFAEATAILEGAWKGWKEEARATARPLWHLRVATATRSLEGIRIAMQEIADLGADHPGLRLKGNVPLHQAILALAAAGQVASATHLVDEGTRDDPAGERDDPEGRRFLASFRTWAAGDHMGAKEFFREWTGKSDLGFRYTGFLLVGEMARQDGNCPAAVAALEQARSLPYAMNMILFWPHTYPGLLHSLATCYEGMGDLARARERNDELLRRWARADPDLPLVLEAKAMQSRLAAK
jgi:serine/threonine protein kinase/tetratricopeptide (TPR) repeat protein